MLDSIKNKKLSAFSTIELILALAMFMVLVLGLSAAMSFGVQQEKVISEDTKATYLLEEGIEALVNIRDANFGSLVNGTYGLALVGNRWQLVATPDVSDGYTRTITITSPNTTTRDMTISISWIRSIGGLQEITATQRLTNIAREIIIDTADWSQPVQEALLNLTGPNTAVSELAVQGTNVFGYKATTTSPNTYGINLSSPASPSQFVTGFFTNMRGIATYNGYMYASSSENSRELQVINPSGVRLTSVDINLTGNGDGNKMVVQDNFLYYTRASQNGAAQFWVFDLSNPAAPVIASSVLINTALSLTKIIVDGDYAYTATGTTTSELVIFDISDPYNASFLVAVDLPSNGLIQDFAIAGDRLYISRNNSNVVHIFNISNPASISQVNTVTMPERAITMDVRKPTNDYLFAGTNSSTRRFTVWDISNLDNPVFANSLTYNNAINWIKYIPGIDRVVAGTANTSQEILIYRPTEL